MGSNLLVSETGVQPTYVPRVTDKVNNICQVHLAMGQVINLVDSAELCAVQDKCETSHILKSLEYLFSVNCRKRRECKSWYFPCLHYFTETD